MKEENKELNVLTFKILWGTFISSQILFGLILYYFSVNAKKFFPNGHNNIIPNAELIMTVIGIIGTFLAFYLFKININLAKEKLKNANFSKLTEFEICSNYHPALMLYLMTAQAICSFGFAFSFLNGKPTPYCIGFIISVLLFITKYPNSKKIIATLKER